VDILAPISPDLWHFIAIFVEAIRILNRPLRSPLDLKRAERLLNVWQTVLPVILGERSQTYNAHGVGHLVDQYIRFGCLWSVSAFPFEGFNCSYTRLITSGKGVASQLSWRFALLKSVDSWINSQTDESSLCSVLLQQMFPRKVKLTDDGNSVQLLDPTNSISSSLSDLLKDFLASEPSADTVFAHRARIRGTVYHSEAYYRKGRQTTASCLATLVTESSLEIIFAEIKPFFHYVVIFTFCTGSIRSSETFVIQLARQITKS